LRAPGGTTGPDEPAARSNEGSDMELDGHEVAQSTEPQLDVFFERVPREPGPRRRCVDPLALRRLEFWPGDSHRQHFIERPDCAGRRHRLRTLATMSALPSVAPIEVARSIMRASGVQIGSESAFRSCQRALLRMARDHPRAAWLAAPTLEVACASTWGGAENAPPRGSEPRSRALRRRSSGEIV